jgi:hypothetical protein
VIVTSRTGARAAAADAGNAEAGRRDRRRHGAAFGGVDLVPAVSTQEGLLAELPRPAGRVLVRGGEGARTCWSTSSKPPSSRSIGRASSSPIEPRRRPRGAHVRLDGRAFGRLGVDLRRSASGRRRARGEQAGVRVVAEAETHDVAGLLAAVTSRACSSPS